jgi:hypothetical protein
MAYTATKLKGSVHGDQRVEQYLVAADAASGSVSTGLKYVDCVTFAPKSCATAGFKIKANLSDAGAASNGSVMVSSAASGDDFYLVVFGR